MPSYIAVYNSMLSFLKIWRYFIKEYMTSRGHVGGGSCRPRVSYHLKLWPGTFAEHLDYDPSPKWTNSPSGCGLVAFGGNVGTLTSSTGYMGICIYIYICILYIYILLYVIVKVQMDSLKTSHCIHRQNAIGSIKSKTPSELLSTPHPPIKHIWMGSLLFQLKYPSHSNCHTSPRLCSLSFRLHVITLIFYIRYIRCIGTTHLYIIIY